MALDTTRLGEALKRRGFLFYSGVPCSFLSDLINYAINECRYVSATNEGDAVAICAGAHVGGEKTVVMMQNSGLGNAVSPLTSLNFPFQIPVLGFVSLRGETGIQDEPQHELMGQITMQLLETMDVTWEFLASDLDEMERQLDRADQCYLDNKPFFFVVKKGTLSEVSLRG